MLRNQLENSRFRFIDALCFIKIFCLRLIFRECVAWWSKTKCGFSKTKSQTPYIAGILPITQFINLATLATALTVLLEWSGLGSRQNSQYLVGLMLFGFLSLKNHIFGYKIFDHQVILSPKIRSKQKKLYKSKCSYKTKSTVFQAGFQASVIGRLLSDTYLVAR